MIWYFPCLHHKLVPPFYCLSCLCSRWAYLCQKRSNLTSSLMRGKGRSTHQLVCLGSLHNVVSSLAVIVLRTLLFVFALCCLAAASSHFVIVLCSFVIRLIILVACQWLAPILFTQCHSFFALCHSFFALCHQLVVLCTFLLFLYTKSLAVCWNPRGSLGKQVDGLSELWWLSKQQVKQLAGASIKQTTTKESEPINTSEQVNTSQVERGDCCWANVNVVS